MRFRMRTTALALVAGAVCVGGSPASADTQKAPAPALPIPAARTFAHEEIIWQGFHQASGYGMVDLRPMLLAESPELRLNTMFVFEGKRLAAPPKWVSVGLVSRAPRPRFTASPTLTVLLDGGTPLRFGMFRQARDSAGTAIERRGRRRASPCRRKDGACW